MKVQPTTSGRFVSAFFTSQDFGVQMRIYSMMIVAVTKEMLWMGERINGRKPESLFHTKVME